MPSARKGGRRSAVPPGGSACALTARNAGVACALGARPLEERMWSNLFGSKDFWAGLMLIALGGMTVLASRAYPMGTVLRMGAGYFPTVLGAILIVFGLILLIKGVRSTDRIEPNWSPRALVVIPVTLVLFGLLVERIGFAPSLLILIVGSAAASSEFRLLEAISVGAVLTALCVAVFIWGLGLPYPLLVLPR